MRKIERSMNTAISGCLDWHQGNTRVTFSPESNESHVYLYGSLIASVGEDYVRLYSGGFRTATTKSRLNSLLIEHGFQDRVYQRGGCWYVESEGTVLPFTEGMILSGV